jgi:monofunctional biosynthetic peptidoglycan transglycosylase
MLKRFFITWLKRLIFMLILAAAAWLGYQFIWPDVGGLASNNPVQSALMEQRQKQWSIRGSDKHPNWQWTPLSRISPNLVQAVLIAEDDKFYSHHGFDFQMLKKAAQRNFQAGKIKYGASTITQQLAKNLFLSQERSPVRKLREAILAWRLEQNLSKNRILELYLNYVEWGPGVFGAEAASRRHFGISANQLSPLQAARLATVLPNPLRMKPNSGTDYVTQRSQSILRVMKKRGYGRIWK